MKLFNGGDTFPMAHAAMFHVGFRAAGRCSLPSPGNIQARVHGGAARPGTGRVLAAEGLAS